MTIERKTINNRTSILLFLTFMFSITLNAQVSTQHQTNIDQCKSLEDDEPVKAISFAKNTLNNIPQIKEPIYFGHMTGCLGWALAMSNQNALSRIQAEELEKHTNSLKESKAKSSLYMRAGGVFHILGDRIGASSNYNKAYDVAENLKLKKELIPILVNLGVLNSELKEHVTAIDNYNYALKLMSEINDFRYKPPVLFNLALTLNGQEMYQEGLEKFLQIESMIDENWPKGRVSQVHSGLSNSYFGLENYTLAKLYNDKTLKYHNESGVQINVKILTEVSQAKILQHLGQHDLAKKYADNAYQYYMKPEGRDGLTYGSNGLNNLAEIFEDYGDLKKSVEIYKLSHELYNTFQESFNKESIAQMQARLINGQQREELLDLKHKNTIDNLKTEQQQEKNQREIFIASIFVGLLILFLIWLRILNSRLKKVTLRDSLTKLSNRRALKIWLMNHPLKTNNHRYLWMIDLDHFKRINDKYGHDKGDIVLISISNYLKKLKTPDNFIGRWGGEEFIFITDDISTKDIHHYANRILKDISQLQLDDKNKQIKMTASIGISQVIENSKQAWDTSLNQADNALYQAKDSGRNCFITYTNES
jgi:diguanylate cyclase (GGDEF)-like protein